MNREELRQLFKSPTLLKHRIALALIYSGGLRSQEVSNMKISGIDFERKTIHIRQSKYRKDRIVRLSDYITKRITKNGKYLYPVLMLSPAFRNFMLKKLKLQFKQSNQLLKYQSLLDDVWKKPWVVYCKPPFGNAQPRSLGVKYPGQTVLPSGSSQ